MISQLLEDSDRGMIQDPTAVLVVQESIVMLCRKLHAIMDLVEFSNADLTRAFNEVVAGELLEITNFEWINEIALLAH